MTKIEIAEAIKNTNMYELACKTNAKLDLTDSEKVTVAQLDAYFKEVGERGADPECEIAAFIRKTINEEIYNTPDELLDYLFNRDTIGEFDDFEGGTHLLPMRLLRVLMLREVSLTKMYLSPHGSIFRLRPIFLMQTFVRTVGSRLRS